MSNTIEKVLEREYNVLDKEISEKQSQSFSEEDDYGFIKKSELTKNWLSLFLLIDEVAQKEEKLKEVQQETQDKHIFDIEGELYEIDFGNGIPKKVKRNPSNEYYLRNAINLKSRRIVIYPMPIKPKLEELIPEEIREDVINIFDNSTKKNYWKSSDAISQISGYSKQEIEKAINSDKPKSFFKPSIFVQNSEGKYSTRKAYEEYTPFFKKFMDGFQLRID